MRASQCSLSILRKVCGAGNTMRRKQNKAPTVGLWAGIAAGLTALMLIFDFITKGLGGVDKIQVWCCAPPPKVAVYVLDNDWGGQCLKFAFQDLPEDFVLGSIRLDIRQTQGPTQITGDQAANIYEAEVNAILKPEKFYEKTPININAPFQSTKTRDAAFFCYCPILERQGSEVTLTVVPTFLTHTGTPINNLKVVWPGPDIPVSLAVSYPKNLHLKGLKDLKDLKDLKEGQKCHV